MTGDELFAAVLELSQQPRSLEELTDADRSAVEAAIKRPRRRQALSDEELREIAQDYTTFVKLGQRDPTIQVARKHHGSRSTASRWIRRARELGFLEPTSKQESKQ